MRQPETIEANDNILIQQWQIVAYDKKGKSLSGTKRYDSQDKAIEHITFLEDCMKSDPLRLIGVEGEMSTTLYSHAIAFPI